MKKTDCDFVESTEYGNYCFLEHCTCTAEECEIFKHGLGKEDLKQAAEEMALLKADMNR